MKKRTQIILAFAAVYILWGSTFVAIRYTVHLLHPAFVSGIRYVLAGMILLAYLLIRRKPVRLSKREWRQVIVLGLLMFTVNTTLVSYAGKILSAGLTALFVASIPLFVAVFELGLPGGSTMSRSGWLGTGMGFAGLAILSHHSIRGQSLTSSSVLAAIALIVASIAWAIGSLISRQSAIRSNPLVFITWQMLFAGSVNILIGTADGGLRSSQWTLGASLSMIYLAIFGTLAGYISYVFLLKNVSLASATTYAYINPIVAVLLGWALLHETLHGTEWLGMVVILVSVGVVIVAKQPTHAVHTINNGNDYKL